MCLAVAVLQLRSAEVVALTDLGLANLHFEGWKKPTPNRALNGQALSIAKQKYERGIGTRATSTLWLELDGKTERFQALAGVDDGAGNAAAAVVFSVYGDGKKLWESSIVKLGQPAITVDVALAGVKSLLLMVDHAGESNAFDHADWIEPRFTVNGAAPRTIIAPHEEPVLLTPKPPVSPRINAAKVYGCRPGNPFLYRIPTTGERPMVFTSAALPPGLRLDAANGIITGQAPARGTYAVKLQAKNRHGESAVTLKIVSGDTLSLTPSMGWNHWYAHYSRVTDKMMREAADVMVKTGMADVGYAYVNIDDCWMNTTADTKRHPDALRIGPFRDDAGRILPNKHFPDMPALTAYIHAYGLKAGIYTSPGPLTCAGYAGAYEHEALDARQFAEWGFDFLKYDWCSYGKVVNGDKTLPTLKKPYTQMGDLLRAQPRDMLFNLCQYGMGDVWKWGAEVGGQSWRTADDLGAYLNRFFDVALKNAGYREWSKPGAWNDPDYIQIGRIGDARTEGELKPCPLTPTEQYSFMSLWCLMASPLFYSGDMSQLDELTLNVLCNPEVIAINQDPLGESARVVKLSPQTFLMVKQLEDGTKAVGLCNRGEVSASITAKWSDVGVAGKQVLRDLWRQQDIGSFETEFSAVVPRHGVTLVRVQPAKR